MLTFVATALCALHVVAWLTVPDRAEKRTEAATSLSLDTASA
jgi:hypothetical protein